ncbi:hypothetical protein [Leptospira mayottensis]|uniref:PLU-1-like domain protein n=2 Tax=Leptospira mayottensis TaxID=1137606 RepID=A0AA87MKZ6_9LEPT|nr:hypothetical protein [Leptospira mayottensis]AXR62795.1 hypothetical protein DQM68_19280 [Leptospira mayottensis]AXR66308.1 hypothetical protein DQM28_18955 [Leptospira mayottensis]AZQ03942.1 hypothetical protein LEP1GSC190_17875 [Leptospira mayottensis 200901116]EKR99137.1 hypothetical protein LEP1GSC125_3719 [Leptospira mayottensis 200901122]TGN17738.1 hypothetical protein EHR03_01335 [Leptospira mayottensis]
MQLPELETYFQTLADLTDAIAVVNSPYESDFNHDIGQLEQYFTDIASRPWEASERDYFNLFSSHFTFHTKIVEEIIFEARRVLMPERRVYVKRLVAYHKHAEEWFAELQRKRRQFSQKDMVTA